MAPQGSELWYMVFPVIILGIALLHYRKPKTGLLLLFILLFFSMFRGDHVGNDTLNYLDENQISYSAANLNNGIDADNLIENFGNKIEFGAVLLNYIVYNMDLPPRLIVFTYSLLTILFLYFALKKLKVNTSLGLAFYVLAGLYFFSLSAARQMAAVSIFIYGFTFVFREDNKRFLFFPFIIIAASFHISALFYIWLYLLRSINLKRSFLLVVMTIICLFMILSSINIMDYVYRLFDLEYVARYMGEFDDSERSLLGRVFDLIRFGFLVYVYSIRKNGEKCDIYDTTFALAVVLMALFGHSSMLVARITYYITIVICMYIPKVMVEQRLLNNKQYMSFFIIFVITTINGMRGWADLLTSGYYLMF